MPQIDLSAFIPKTAVEQPNAQMMATSGLPANAGSRELSKLDKIMLVKAGVGRGLLDRDMEE